MSVTSLLGLIWFREKNHALTEKRNNKVSLERGLFLNTNLVQNTCVKQNKQNKQYLSDSVEANSLPLTA